MVFEVSVKFCVGKDFRERRLVGDAIALGLAATYTLRHLLGERRLVRLVQRTHLLLSLLYRIMEEITICSKLILSITGRMVRFNTDSIFRKVDLENADSIRRIMVGLDYYLTNQVLNSGAPEIRALRGPDRSEERYITNTILSTIRTQLGYPLLLEAVLRFIEARNGNDQQVLAAARDLETLAPGMVLTVPQAYLAEYAAAEARFNRTRAVDNFRAAHQNHLILEQRVLGFLAFIARQ